MKFNILALLRRPAPVIQPEVVPSLSSLPARVLKAMLEDHKTEGDALKDAHHIALARERGQRAYRIDFNFTLNGECGWQTFWNTSNGPHAVLEDLRRFAINKRNQHRGSYVLGEAVLVDLLTGHAQHRSAQEVFAVA